MRQLILTVLFFISFFQLQSQTRLHTLTIIAHVKLKHIPVSIGQTFSLHQMCKWRSDTSGVNQYFFENATVGKIKSCNLKFDLAQDTITSIVLYLSGEKSYLAASRQAKKDFGPGIFIQTGETSLFTWISKVLNPSLAITLIREQMEWASEMHIQRTFDDTAKQP